MEMREIYRYYQNPLVRKEIADYSKNRWIALYATSGVADYFIRYWSRKGEPLQIRNEKEIDILIARFKSLGPRTIYASVNIYSKLFSKDDVERAENIVRCTPIWDIDGSLEYWEKVVEVARVILDVLEREGIVKSVYLKWSGRGIHIHVHENAFSEDLLKKYHPLDVAYSVVDYVLKRAADEILRIAKGIEGGERPLKVENEIDLKRVFTVPLSLHKSLDLATIVIKPNQLDDFTPEWAKPNVLKHNTEWRIYEVGEADELAEKAMREVGGYFKRVGTIRTVVQVEEQKREESRPRGRIAKVGRFQVMALLQAARYYTLTGDLEKAKSFGLNRAIFYAWAKYHGRSRIPFRRAAKVSEKIEIKEEKGRKMAYVGNEAAPISDRGWFMIGDKEQLPSDFDKEVKEKIEDKDPFEKAWQIALDYIKSFPKSILLDQRRFYEEVYKKVRDQFLDIVQGKKKLPKFKTLV